jgi:hypothetical protein
MSRPCRRCAERRILVRTLAGGVLGGIASALAAWLLTHVL